MILAERGYELESQLERLHGYLSEPPGALTNAAALSAAAAAASQGSGSAPGSRSGSGSGSGNRRTARGAGPGKEDIDARSGALEHGYHGPVLDAFLGSDEEGGTPRRHRREDEGGDGVGVDVGGGDPDRDEGLSSGARADDVAVPGTAAAKPRAAAPSDSLHQGQHDDGDLLDRDGVGTPEPMPLPVNTTQTAGEAALSVAAGAAAASPTASTGAALSATEAETGERRGGRARALMTAPGVDAASGVRGWRRRRVKNGGGGGGEGGGEGDDDGAGASTVTVVQDVLSVLFGWDVSGRRKGAGGGGRESSSGTGVMFA